MEKTIRFGDLVRASGRPQPVTLWFDPKKDRSFSKAVQANRVLTIHSNPAAHRKEYGEIGFQRAQGATYLVFPQPLPKKSASRIIGINYQLAEEPPPKDPLPHQPPSKPARKAANRPKPVVAERKPDLKRSRLLFVAQQSWKKRSQSRQPAKLRRGNRQRKP
jgi:hypothetical protein